MGVGQAVSPPSTEDVQNGFHTGDGCSVMQVQRDANERILMTVVSHRQRSVFMFQRVGNHHCLEFDATGIRHHVNVYRHRMVEDVSQFVQHDAERHEFHILGEVVLGQ